MKIALMILLSPPPSMSHQDPQTNPTKRRMIPMMTIHAQPLSSFSMTSPREPAAHRIVAPEGLPIARHAPAAWALEVVIVGVFDRIAVTVSSSLENPLDDRFTSTRIVLEELEQRRDERPVVALQLTERTGSVTEHLGELAEVFVVVPQVLDVLSCCHGDDPNRNSLTIHSGNSSRSKSARPVSWPISYTCSNTQAISLSVSTPHLMNFAAAIPTASEARLTPHAFATSRSNACCNALLILIGFTLPSSPSDRRRTRTSARDPARAFSRDLCDKWDT